MNPTDHDNDDQTTPETTQTGTESTAGSAGELATVHPLRARPDQQQSTGPGAVESAPEVIEGEIVTDEQWRLYTSQKAQLEWRLAEYKRQAQWVGTHAVTVVRHDRTVRTAKFGARHTAYVFTGAGIVAKRAWEAKTNSRYERLMRGAEARGNFEELKHWEERAEAARERRHTMDLLSAPMKLLKAAGVGLAGLVSFLCCSGSAPAGAGLPGRHHADRPVRSEINAVIAG